MKEEALALSVIGLIAALITWGYKDRKTWRWLTPFVVAFIALICWYAFVGLAHGYITNKANVKEFAFTVHQITHPLALIKRAAYVCWQAIVLVTAGAACVPFVTAAIGLSRKKAKECLESNAISVAATVVAIVLIGWHSIAGKDALVRYLLPVGALFIGAGAVAGGVQMTSSRQSFAKLVAIFATFSMVWLVADLRFLGKNASVTEISGRDFSREYLQRALQQPNLQTILTSRQAAISPRIYEDEHVLHEVERVADESRLHFIGASALFTTQIETAMDRTPLVLSNDRRGNPSVLINKFSPRACVNAIANIADNSASSAQLHVLRVRNGDSVDYIVQSSVGLPACEFPSQN
jgi:hypothetical protein